MNRIGEWLRRFWYLFNRVRFESELAREMESHRAMMGNPEKFGDILRLRERSHEVWGWSWLDNIVRDFRFAVRGLGRTPGFTLVAILSLALGLSLAASAVSVVNAYLIRSLPYPDSDRLYHVMYAPPGPWEPGGMTALDWTALSDVVEAPIASSGDTFYLLDDGSGPPARGLRVVRGFVEGLRVSVASGRTLMAQDFIPGSERVALMGHTIWRDRYGSDSGMIGRLVRGEAESRPGDPEAFRIVGVLSPGFYFGRDSRNLVDLIVPLTSMVRTYMVRLREGVPPSAAERSITEAARRVATTPIPEGWAGVRLESAHERYVGAIRPILAGATGAASLVLIIVSANLAVLMLLRSMRRQKEVALRLALGSGRLHVARMLLAESAVICTAALGVALTLTALMLGALAPVIETHLGRPAPHGTSSITVDSTVLVVIGAISVIVALMLSLAPLLMSRDRQLTDALRQDGRGTGAGPSMRRMRSALIAFELAGSLVLLACCGLMIRSALQMMHTDLGFRADGLMRTRVVLRARKYPDGAAYRRFYEQLADRVSAVTGSPVVFTNWPPFTITPKLLIEKEAGGDAVRAGTLGVSAGYFSIHGVHIRQGRDFTAAEASAAEPVAVVSETLSSSLWPDGGALGKRVRGVEQTQGGSTPGPWRTIVGIAADVRQAYEDVDRKDFYTPMLPDSRFGSFYLQTRQPMPSLLQALRMAVAGIDPDAIVNEPRPVPAEDQRLSGTKFMSLLLTAFAAIGLFLAMLGIYGATAYTVQQRRKEIAVRVALGASKRTVSWMFLREAALVLGMGMAGGLLCVVPVSRVLRNQVYGVESLDPLTYAVACTLLIGTGLAAVWWPARRAAMCNPSTALNTN